MGSAVSDSSVSKAPEKKIRKEHYFGSPRMIVKRFKREWPLHMLLIPAFVVTAIFSYGPMYGLIMAFQNFSPVWGFIGSPFVGLENFRWLIAQEAFVRTIANTFFISIMKIVLGTSASILFALLLNEIRISFC